MSQGSPHRAATAAAVDQIVQRASEGEQLALPEIEQLLSLDNPAAAAPLFSAARRLRERHFGTKIFLYGFVYFSTFCRNRCTFCFYRRGNAQSPRYRKSRGEVVEIAHKLASSGVHLVDLTMGEDPLIHETRDFQSLIDLVGYVRRETGLPVMVSPGVVPNQVLQAFRRVGADWYACYQETHNPALYRRLRPGQDYIARFASRSLALAAGLRAEDGILLGVGETPCDRAHSLLAMRRQGVQQVRAMSFVPQKGTPLERIRPPSPLTEQVTLAVMRLVMPDRLIPASLDVDGLSGLQARLQAGANVVTSIIPPAAGLAGVSQATLDIDQGLRTVEGVLPQLQQLGLEPATHHQYAAWLATGSSVAA